MLSGMLYNESTVKSVASCKEDGTISGEGTAEEGIASVGVGVFETGATSGAEEAKRTVTPFRIILFVFEIWDLECALEVDTPFLRRSGFGLKAVCCTTEEENYIVSI